jgi:hypothetical protein
VTRFDGAEPEPLVSKAPTYEDLMDLLRRVADEPYGPPDTFEGARHVVCMNDTDGDGDCASCARYGSQSPCRQMETRVEAKGRLMLEQYAREGRPIRDAHLWSLRAEYARVYQFVQGVGGGLPYSTHNWAHFYNRYGAGMDGRRAPVLMVGLKKDTLMECARAAEQTRVVTLAVHLLSH